MKKIIYAAFCAAALSVAGCSDFLETSSPSTVDGEFVFSNMTTARTAMDGAYEAWRGAANSNVFGAGLHYAADLAGSDIERHPEAYTAQPQRHVPECFYVNGTLTSTYDTDSYSNNLSTYSSLYETISKCNAIITAMKNASYFEEIMSAGVPSNQTQLYGEAIALRATCYRELIKYYGDVPYNDTFGVPANGLAPRDSIYDVVLKDLQVVEPLMYRVGDNGVIKAQMSRTYVQGLIGRIALEAGGYQTRRSDMKYVDGDGNALTFETKGKPNANAENAVYGRRSDWKTKYELAKKYFGECLANSGTAKLLLTDPRATESNGRTYGNPYQYFFQELHIGDDIYATESIYEYEMPKGVGNERPYSNGRPSSGGNRKNNDGYPCKGYGQGRIVPAYYYGVFDPNDMRRDVSVTVTGSHGKNGTEKLLPVAPNSKADGGGMSLSKYDENRVEIPWAKQRQSGINGPYMRIAEIYLGMAEACAALGENGTATQYLKTIRERSFPAGMAKTEEFIAKCGSVLDAVIEERGFEYAGEGDRRWVLIRTGKIGDKIRAMKELMKKMIDGLKADGYYRFENGNVISNYIYTKLVDAKSMYGYRLTAQCTDENDPVLFPGWRGQHDDWAAVAVAGGFKFASANLNETNLAIQGLFKPLTEAEAAALVADGYTKVDWGKAYVANEEEYYNKYFNGYDYESAPIYLWPFTENTCLTSGLHNGYGFSDN